jgi:thymidylate synthase (FAD)
LLGGEAEIVAVIITPKLDPDPTRLHQEVPAFVGKLNTSVKAKNQITKSQMTARLVSVSAPVIPGLKTAEDLVAYVARVSNPPNQLNGDTAKLLNYCLKHGHWSVFETATMTVEIETTRAIAAQIVRHRSFCVQEFSQRYAVCDTDPEPQEARSQDPKNRQASNDDLSEDVKAWWIEAQRHAFDTAADAYNGALRRGIAKECARFVLPLATPTRMYVTANVRSWITYLQVRTADGAQKEHADVAEAIKKVFVEQFPVISRALGWLV